MHFAVLRSMKLYMLREISILCEASSADVTGERFVTSVNSHMVKEVPGLFERFRAPIIITPEHSPFTVGVLALFEIDFEGVIWDVDVIVHFQQVFKPLYSHFFGLSLHRFEKVTLKHVIFVSLSGVMKLLRMSEVTFTIAQNCDHMFVLKFKLDKIF